MPQFAFVYTGDGASQRSVLSTIESLKATLDGLPVRQLNGMDLLEGGWQEHSALLIFPGGADLPYCKFLNGQGNKIISEYVRAGGAYLGLCAGGYYACRRVEFEEGLPLEVMGDRELSFFPGLAKGSVEPGFEYNTEAGANAIPIRFKDLEGDGSWCDCHDYCNGGPSFMIDKGQENSIEILAEYTREPTGSGQEERGAAAVKCQVEKGVAVLCGTHPELSPWWLDASCRHNWMKRAHPDLGDGQISVLVQRAKYIKSALVEDEKKRGQFLKSLLIAAGIGNYIRPSCCPCECIHDIAKGIISGSPRRSAEDILNLESSPSSPQAKA